MPRGILVCVTLLASLCTHSATQAVDYSWQNSVGGAFVEPSNWTPAVPPGPGGAGDTVNFDLGVTSSRYVLTDVEGENDQLIIHNDTLELNVFFDYTLLSVGGMNPSFVVGASSGDIGNVVLSGDFNNVLTTRVASLGNVAGSTGIVFAQGLQWTSIGNLRVGHAGTGRLFIEDDASLTNNSNVFIGNLAGSVGEVDVGVDATWTVGGDLLVGREGTGSLSILTRSTVTSENASIGVDSTGDGTASISGTSVSWTITDSLTVGENGEGFLFIGNSGIVNNNDAFVGRFPGSDGHVSATEGLWTTTGQLSIGGDADAGAAGGDGLVEITVGADVKVDGEITIFPDGALTLDVNSSIGSFGSLSAEVITVETGGQFDWTRGSLFLSQFNGNELRNEAGILATRPGSNTISISGEYAQQADGVLSLEISGTAASGEFDSVVVGNTAFLGGELRIGMADLFEPGPDEVYTILDALNLGAGSFENVASGERLTTVDGLGSFLVHYGSGSPFDVSQVVLSDFLPTVLPGDYNDNGVVDAADYAVWRDNEGTNNVLPNDSIGGTIGTAHYDQWRTHFGRTAAGAASRAALDPAKSRPRHGGPVDAIPEPTSLLLLTIGWAMLPRGVSPKSRIVRP